QALWLFIMLLIFLAGVALLIPGSPVYFTKLFAPEGRTHGGHTTSHWLKVLKDPDVKKRQHAIQALGSIGSEATEAVPVLVTIMLEDPDAKTRVLASEALARMDPPAKEAVPAFAESTVDAFAQALGDEDGLVRMNAALGLGRLRTHARPAVPALLRA